jgi:hypothetical protein
MNRADALRFNNKTSGTPSRARTKINVAAGLGGPGLGATGERSVTA